jgi:hypothetical protein
MKYPYRVLLVGITALVFSIFLEAQQMPTVRMPASPTPNVAVTPFDAAQFPLFARFFTADNAVLQPASFVLTNNSKKAIVAIDVELVTAGSNGEGEMHYSFHSDKFQSPGKGPVVAANDRLLVAPGLFIRESALNSEGGLAVIDFGGSLVARFSAVAQIGINIDSLIFEDGEVDGPNQKRYTDELLARQVAANTIVQVVQNALKDGQQPSAALSGLVSAPQRAGDFVGKWEALFAQKLLKAPNIEAGLASFENLPSLPKFYRTDGGQP